MKYLTCLIFVLYSTTCFAQGSVLTFGKWDLTCSEAGCAGACYIDRKLSDDIAISGTYYNDNLMLRIYYTKDYYDEDFEMVLDDQKVDVEKQRRSSRIRFMGNKKDLFHNAKSVVLKVNDQSFDLSVDDYRNAYEHLKGVQHLQVE